jgi:small basic protein
MNSSTTGWPRISGPLGSAAGFAAGIAATVLASIVGATNHHEIGLFALALAVAIVSALTTILGALATGLQCWLLYASFIVGRSGHLVLDESSAETAGLFTLVALAATGIAGGRTVRARLTR